MTVPWRIAVTLAIGAGLALAIVGLWHTLAAEVGASTRLYTLDDIRARYASVQYQVGQAAASGRRLQTARIVVAAAAPAKPPAYLMVTRPGGTVCGVLNSAP
jgi:hypothetical protein